MKPVAVTFSDTLLNVARADGVRIASACDARHPALSATELLAAALGSCMAASLQPLFVRHHLDLAALRITVSARNTSLEEGFAVSVQLPPCDDDVLRRCERAVEGCPVKRALSIPVAIDWMTS